MRNKKQNIIAEALLVADIADEGRGVAKWNNKVVFVSGAVPGDVVNVRINRSKNTYAEGDAISFVSYSDKRTPTFCQHFGVCGGCKWQNLEYETQLVYKQKQATDAIERIAKMQPEQLLPIVPSPQTTHYRNKMEFTFSNTRWLTTDEMQLTSIDRRGLGLHVKGLFDKVIDLKQCFLQANPSDAIRLAVRNFCVEHDFSFHDIRQRIGWLRNLMIRTTQTGETMVLVSFFFDDEPKRLQLLHFLASTFPQITSLLYVINPKANDTIFDLPVHVYKGNDHIIEKMDDLHFKISAKSFFQTNTPQAVQMYRTVSDWAALKGNEIVYDIYTGTGTIANFVARKAAKVVGVEIIADAIENARENAAINHIDNTLFTTGDAKDVLNQTFFAQHGNPDVVIVDPPRAGLHTDVVEQLLQVEPQRIVYVSCNPSTQARDLQMMSGKYKLSKFQSFDMFPHTHHVEAVALLERL